MVKGGRILSRADQVLTSDIISELRLPMSGWHSSTWGPHFLGHSRKLPAVILRPWVPDLHIGSQLPLSALSGDKIKSHLCIFTPKMENQLTLSLHQKEENTWHSICHGIGCCKGKTCLGPWSSKRKEKKKADKSQLTNIGKSEVSEVPGCLYFLQCS